MKKTKNNNWNFYYVYNMALNLCLTFKYELMNGVKNRLIDSVLNIQYSNCRDTNVEKLIIRCSANSRRSPDRIGKATVTLTLILTFDTNP